MHVVGLPGLVPPDAARIPWRETQVPGVGWLPLHLSSERGPRQRPDGADAGSTVLIRMDPGCGYPRHEHLDVEEVLCLAGGYADELGVVRAGDYARYEKGTVHAPVALAGEPCVLFAIARGGIRIGSD